MAAKLTTHLNWAPMIVAQVGIPACVEERPGTAKTATIAALARKANREFYSIELPRRQPEDLTGYPTVQQITVNGREYKYMDFVPDKSLLMAALRPSVMLIDEVTNTSGARQAAALNLLANGLPDCWMFMACNPISSAVDGYPLQPPFVNRIWKGLWQLDNAAHDEGSYNNLSFPEPVVPIVPADYMQHHSGWGLKRAFYHQAFPQYRNDYNESNFHKENKPFASNRSWTNLERSLAAASAVFAVLKEDLPVTLMNELATGFVGPEVGVKFIDFHRKWDQPLPGEILANIDTYDPPANVDIIAPLLSCVISHMKSLADSEAASNSPAYIEFIRKMQEKHPDIVVAYKGKLLSVLSVKERRKLAVAHFKNLQQTQ